jgi:hypothetical protein
MSSITQAPVPESSTATGAHLPGQPVGTISPASLARKLAIRKIGVGLAVLIVGIVITVVTYSNAASSPSGGTYVVAWGPMVFGAITVLRGLVGLTKSRRLR